MTPNPLKPVVVLLVLGACARGGPRVNAVPDTAPQIAEAADSATVDSLWEHAQARFRRGKWSDAAVDFERLVLEMRPGDTRIAQVHFFTGESYFAMKDQLRAAREFRKVSDEMPNAPLAPRALLRVGDAYRDLWRRPELDPSYGLTALSTYRELANRYPQSDAAKVAQARISELEEWFAKKEFKAAEYYLKLKVWDSAIIYLKDLAATYPRASVTPHALIELVDAYRKLGYTEDVNETCGYLRQYHPNLEETDEHCPAPPSGTG